MGKRDLSESCWENNSCTLFPGEHGYLSSRMNVVILNIFEINYSQLIQYEILEKLVTYISKAMQSIMVYSLCKSQVIDKVQMPDH